MNQKIRFIIYGLIAFFLLITFFFKESNVINDLPITGSVPDFEFIDSNGETITREDMEGKVWVADFIFTISRTIDDKVANSGRLFVAKNRNGPDGLVFPLFMDTSNVCIKVLEPSEEDEVVAVSVKKQKENLVEKYQKFKKNNGG